MDISAQLLFFFSALGAFNGLLLSAYFLFLVKPKHISNVFLGGVLAMLSIRIGKSVFFFFNPDLAKIYLQIGLSACFLIGPFLYLHVRSMKDHLAIDPLWKWLLGSCLAIVLGVGMVYPYEHYPALWGDFYTVINYQWLVFIILSVYSSRMVFQKLWKERQALQYKEVLSLNVIVGVTIIWVGYFTSSFTSYIVGALSFSVLFYLSLFVSFSFRKRQRALTEKQKERYANRKVTDTEVQPILTQIEHLMQQEQLYKDPNLTLAKLAKRLHISSHLLSQVLNDNLNKRFTQFVNEHRIEEAKRLLQSKTNMTMEALAEHCGFNSNSTFYSAFKKVTNTTPAKFMSEKLPE